MRDGPSVFDVFSGCGGLAYGLESAGLKVRWASELQPSFMATHRRNLPDCICFEQDARELLVALREGRKDLPSPGDVDVLCGGPPCQGFCQINRHRRFDDPRNSLVEVFLDFVHELQPRVVLMENVTGILTLQGGAAIRSLKAALEADSYAVRMGVLQCGSYGLPQHRWRVFLLGAKQGTQLPVFPEPSHHFHRTSFVGMSAWKNIVAYPPAAEGGLFGSAKIPRTVKDAISDLSVEIAAEPDDAINYGTCPPSEFACGLRTKGGKKVWDHAVRFMDEITMRRIRLIPSGGGWQDLPPDLQPANLKRFSDDAFRIRYGRLRWDQPFKAIITKPDPYWGCFIHPDADRLISVRESARAQSFPDHFRFCGSITSRYVQIGNAVPPLMGALLGAEIRAALGDKYAREEVAANGQSFQA